MLTTSNIPCSCPKVILPFKLSRIPKLAVSSQQPIWPRQLSRIARICRRSRENRRIFPALIIAVETDKAVSAPSFLLGTFAVAFQDLFHFQDKIKHCFPPHKINLQCNCRPRSWPETKAVKFATFRVIFVRKGKRKERSSWMEFRSFHQRLFCSLIFSLSPIFCRNQV